MPREGRVRNPDLPPDAVVPLEGPVARMAEEVGLRMVGRNRRINTRLALAAAEYARDQGRFSELHEALLRAHWTAGARLDSVDDLARIGGECGLDPGSLRRALEDGSYEDRIDRWRQEATAVGIEAIPAHIFGGRYLVLGAQPMPVLRSVLARLSQE